MAETSHSTEAVEPALSDADFDLIPQIGHFETISAITTSTNLTYALTADYSGTLALWDLNKRVLRHRFTPVNCAVTQLAFSPNNHRGAALCPRGGITVFDLHTGSELLRQHTTPYEAHKLSFSPDGRWLVTSNHNTLLVLDAQTGAPVFETHIDVAGWTWSSATELFFVERIDRDHTPHLRSVRAPAWPKPKKTEPKGLTKEYDSAFSADGSRLLLGHPGHGASLHDVRSGRRLLSVTGHNQLPVGVAFGPGDTLITSGGGSTQIWSAQTGERLGIIYTQSPRLAAVSDDGQQLVTIERDQLQVWDVATRERRRAVPSSETIAFPKAEHLFVGNNTSFYYNDFASSPSDSPELGYWSGASPFSRPDDLSSDGRWLLADKRRLIDLHTGHELTLPDQFSPLELARNGRLVGRVSHSEELRTFTPWTNQAQVLQPPSRNSDVDWSHLLWSRNASLLIVGGSKRNQPTHARGWGPSYVWVWDTNTGKLLRELGPHDSEITVAATSNDGRLQATHCKDEVFLWHNGKRTPPIKASTSIVELQFFSNDQALMARTQGELWVWDTTTRREVLHQTHYSLKSIAGAPELLLATPSDATAKHLVEVPSGIVLSQLNAGVERVVASPSGRWLLTCMGSRLQILERHTGTRVFETQDPECKIAGLVTTTSGMDALVTSAGYLRLRKIDEHGVLGPTLRLRREEWGNDVLITAEDGAFSGSERRREELIFRARGNLLGPLKTGTEMAHTFQRHDLLSTFWGISPSTK